MGLGEGDTTVYPKPVDLRVSAFEAGTTIDNSPGMIRRWIHTVHECYTARQADVVIVSYPKSGRTWLRVMIGYVLVGYYRLEDIALDSPDILVNHLAMRKHNPAVPFFYFSHDDKPHTMPASRIEEYKGRWYDKPLVFLYRDPRDVVVSQYFSLTRRTKGNHAYQGTLRDFVRDMDYGPLNHITYLNIWARQFTEFSNLLRVSYRSIHEDAEGVLTRVLAQGGLTDVPADIVAMAVERARFENMRKMEKKQVFSGHMLRPVDVNDQNAYKTRQGEVGGYTKHLDPEDQQFLNELIALKLDPVYGYR